MLASETLSQVRQSDVVEKPFAGAVAGSPFRTERRPLLYLSQGREQHAVQFPRAGSFHLGFDKELMARFPDGALRRQLPESVPDRLGIGAVDACLELELHRDSQSCRRDFGRTAGSLVLDRIAYPPSHRSNSSSHGMQNGVHGTAASRFPSICLPHDRHFP